MPSETFLRLPAEKQARLVDAALDEFASHPFAEASISRIVARLGIAKGSIYQYFDDKVDLFCWLVAEQGRRKAELVGSLPAEGPIWQRLRAGYRAGLVQWQCDPRWARLGLRALEPSTDPRVDALARQRAAAVHTHMVALLREGQAAGDVRRDLDPELAARFAEGALGEGLLAALLDRLGTDLDAWIAHPREVSPEEAGALLAVADEAVAFVQRALDA